MVKKKKLEINCWIDEINCRVIDTKSRSFNKAIVRSIRELNFGGNKLQPSL